MPNPRSIIVTGCSSGIGAHCAARLKQSGWRVFATARKPGDIARLRADGFDALYLDTREPSSIEAMIADVADRTDGRVDALFNSATHVQPGAVEDLPVEALREQFEAAVFGWHDLTRRTVELMRRQGSGRIVQCSSILGVLPMPWLGAYCAAKHALEALTLSMRMELHDSGISVSLIEPGAIDTGLAGPALAYFRRYVDVEASVHAERYTRQIEQLSQGKRPFEARPEAVFSVLDHALNARRPRPHYVVTRTARIGFLARRILPANVLYSRLARRD